MEGKEKGKSNQLNILFDKTIRDLQSGIYAAMSHLQQGMQEYLSNTIDIKELLKMIERMGIPNIMGMKGGTMPGFDPYRILGLDKTATDGEVKERYRSLLFKLHPDKSDIKGTEFLTQMILIAYEMIERERGWK